jgi:hypothetical protein
MIQNALARPAVRAALVTMILAFAAAGCGSSTNLTNVWKDPSYTGPAFQNMLVINANPQAAVRRSTEDIAVGELAKGGVKATPSYSVWPDSLPSVDQIKEFVQAKQIDGVMLSRLVSKEQRDYYVPPTATTVGTMGYPGYWYGYYGSVYQTYYSPGYYGTEQVYRIDTSVWATSVATGEKGKLVWSGTTEAVDPKSATALAQQISGMIFPQMRKAGLIK